MIVRPLLDIDRPALLGEAAFPAERAGGKAATLHELTAAGFTVPPGFIVEPDLDVAVVDDETLAGWVEAIGGFPVAVRSSAAAEDLDEASFAGLYETYLRVNDVDTLRRRIADCRASGRNERVRAYLDHQGVHPKRASVTVLVQCLVEARFSGVGFSIDPITGIEEHALVEWCTGLGERLVSGHVAPSRAVIRLADGTVVEDAVGQDGATLSAEQTAELTTLLLKAQAARHRPQDVEWAIDRDNKLWLLQSRAITAINWRTDVGQLTDADFRDGGVSARVCTPLMYSLYQNAFQDAMQNFWVGLGLLDPDVQPAWISMHYGRAYWNVDAIKDRYANIPGYDERIFDTDLGINKDYGPAGPRRTAATPVTIARALPAAIALNRGYRRQLAIVAWFAARWPAVHALWQTRTRRLPQASEATFAAELVECLHSLHPMTERTYFTTIYHNTAVQGDFKKTLQKVDAATGHTTPMIDLMGGLAAISHMALQSGIVGLHKVAIDHGFEGREWQLALHDFLQEHGFHADIELELTCPRWSEAPERIRELVQGMIRAATPPADPRVGIGAQRRRFDAQLHALHSRVRRNILHRLRFSRLINRQVDRMRRYLVAREQMREFSSQCYAILRAYVVEAGRRFEADGRLACEADIFMLSIHEIADLAAGRLTGADVVGPIEFRRAMYDGYRDISPPHELGGGIADDAAPGGARDAHDLIGLGCSPGVVEGVVRVVSSLAEIGQLRRGDILVTRFTDPGWTTALGLAAGVVTEVGGLLSHAAVIGREYGIPAVLNVAGATQALRSGTRIRVDGGSGRVTVLGSHTTGGRDE
jgi:phosphohistidine swiveling domain-containing protein